MTDNRDVEQRPDEELQSETSPDAAGDGANQDPIEDLFLDPDDSDSDEVEFNADAEPAAAASAPKPTPAPTPAPTPVQNGGPSAADREQLAELEAERDDLKNRLLRTAADLENFRKRSLREKEELRRYGIDRVVLELLPVLDNLERALEHADKTVEGGANSVIDGVKMVHRQFVGALEKHGVKGFESKGTAFDPQKHEAIQQIETAEHETGTVLEEYQKGYHLHDRLIRPAMVVVARRAEGAAEPSSDASAAGPTDDEGDETSAADESADSGFEIDSEAQTDDAELAPDDNDDIPQD